eukprot:SAG11_NODE_8550_length_1002_cov_0.841639_2_plen_90_part_00
MCPRGLDRSTLLGDGRWTAPLPAHGGSVYALRAPSHETNVFEYNLVQISYTVIDIIHYYFGVIRRFTLHTFPAVASLAMLVCELCKVGG